MLTLVVTLNLLVLTVGMAALALLAFVFERALTFESRARRDMQRNLPPKPPKPLPRQPIRKEPLGFPAIDPLTGAEDKWQ